MRRKRDYEVTLSLSLLSQRKFTVQARTAGAAVRKAVKLLHADKRCRRFQPITNNENGGWTNVSVDTAKGTRVFSIARWKHAA